MAARKKSARKKAASKGGTPSGGGGSLWPVKVALVSLRVFTGAVFLSVAHWKLIKPGLPPGESITRFTEGDYLPLVRHAVDNPPNVLGWELTWFSSLIESVGLGGSAPYLIAGAVLIFEALLGICLVLGLGTRLMAFLGALLMAVMGLCKGLPFLTVSRAGGSNWYLMMLLFALALMAAGRIWGLDARLRHRLPRWVS